MATTVMMMKTTTKWINHHCHVLQVLNCHNIIDWEHERDDNELEDCNNYYDEEYYYDDDDDDDDHYDDDDN